MARAKMDEVRRQQPHLFTCRGQELKPMYVYDNPNWHKGADPRKAGISPDQCIKLPTWSPDFNKPIEHAHHYTKRAFNEWLLDNPGSHSNEQVLNKWQELFYDKAAQDTVWRDVKSLQHTYEAVHKAGGGFVEHRNN